MKNPLNLNIFKSSRGLAPGTPIFIGEKKTDQTKVSIIRFNENEVHETPSMTIHELRDQKNELEKTTDIVWINLVGIHNLEYVNEIGDNYFLHKLTVEDILNTSQQPKIDEYEGYLFLVFKLLRLENKEVTSEQVSMIIRDNIIITFQEEEKDCFNPIRERIRNKGRIITRDSGYLAYTLLDAAIDDNLILTYNLAAEIESIEEEIFSNPTKATLNKIYSLKREVNFLIKQMKPELELITGLRRLEKAYFDKKTKPFISDLSDHISHSYQDALSLKESLVELLNIYHSTMSTNLNDVMKILTIYSVIFIPITFLAGVYGMNWESFPELDFKYGYAFFWIASIIIALSMVIWFKRRNWL